MVPFGGRSERNGTNGLLGQRDCSSGKSKADDIRLILGTYVKPDVVLHICDLKIQRDGRWRWENLLEACRPASLKYDMQ